MTTYNLPAAANVDPYFPIVLRNTNPSQSAMVIPAAGDLIDGAAGATVEIYPGNAVELQSDGISRWARIRDFSLPVRAATLQLAEPFPFNVGVWSVVPDLAVMNTYASGIHAVSLRLPVDVLAGQNQDIGFLAQIKQSGVPVVEFEDYQTRVNEGGRLTISVTWFGYWEINTQLTVEVQAFGNGTAYTMRGVSQGNGFAFMQTAGPM